MVISLEGWRRWLFTTGLGLPLLAFLAVAGKEYLASYFNARGDLVHFQRAVKLSPGNADYHARLGRYLLRLGDMNQQRLAAQPLQRAVRLDPYDSRYWLDLAAVQQVLGDSSGQLDAMEHALVAEPTAPDIAWEAANLFVSTGQTDRALREFRVVIENDRDMTPVALNASWRAHPDIDFLLRDVVPNRPDSLLALLSLMEAKQQPDAAIKVWNRLLQLHQSFDQQSLFGYISFLLLQGRPEVAMAGWLDASVLLKLTAYLPTSDNLIVNGDFSDEILNGGFDWVYRTQPGVQLLLDSSDFRVGRRSLSVTFEGPGISDAGIHQFIPVRGQTTYDFSAYYKSSEFDGAGGPEIVIRDAYTNQILLATDDLKDADFWKRVGGQFTTPPSTTLLLLSVERVPRGSPIRGKLWVDNFQLSPAEPNDAPATHQKEHS